MASKDNNKNKQHWRINDQIRSTELRLIGVDDKQIGVVSLTEALKLREEAKTDLVEIAPLAKPPVAKLIDYGKFRYQEEKRLRQQKKKSQVSELKEIRFSPFIAQGDYETRMKRIEEFLVGGSKVRLLVAFKRRQMISRNFGYQLLNKVRAHFGDKISTDSEPKFVGQSLSMTISPIKKNIQAAQITKEK